MPKVSVIMPTYNRAWIIEKAINSVLNQSYTDFELIIVDAVSTDNTKEILSKISDHRVRTHFLTEKKTISFSRNTGIELATGEIIAYLDTDNIWFSNYLEVMVSELTSEYVLAYSGQNAFLVKGNKDKLEVIARNIRDHEYNPALLPTYNFIDTNATIHTKKIIQEIGLFDESLSSCEDWDLFARIAIKYPFKIKHVGQVLGEYYFYFKDTLETLTNNESTDDQLLHIFNIKSPKGDAKYVQEKIKNSLRNV